MKPFKNILFSAMLTLGAFGAVTYTACNKDECKNVTCQNGGTCSGGNCTCPTGYEGDRCQTLSRDKFIGTYTGNETCTVGSDEYSITIATNSDQLKITLTNIYGQGFTGTGTITGPNTFALSGSQTGTTYTGTGTLNGNTLTLAYTITNGVTTNSCTFIGNK